jgi:hypothetical protein
MILAWEIDTFLYTGRGIIFVAIYLDQPIRYIWVKEVSLYV